RLRLFTIRRRRLAIELRDVVRRLPSRPTSRPHRRVRGAHTARDRRTPRALRRLRCDPTDRDRSTQLVFPDEALLSGGVRPAPFGLVAHGRLAISRLYDRGRDRENEASPVLAARRA